MPVQVRPPAPKYLASHLRGAIVFDDRDDVSAKKKFAYVDLIEILMRLIVSKRSDEKIEYKERDKKESF